MALVLGTNCGFVTTVPISDPEGELTNTIDERATAFKVTSPVGNNIITEIGWWCDDATANSNFEVGIYDHNVGDNNPEAIVGVSRTNLKGTDVGWKRVTDLNIPLDASTIYWIAMQLDNTSQTTHTDVTVAGGEKRSFKVGQTTLTDPWGSDNGSSGQLVAFYALIEEVLTSPQGPNNPGTASDDSDTGTVAWTDINNILSSDDTYATCDISGIGVTSHYAKATNFGFSIPIEATINGILVEIERGRVGSSNPANDDEVKIVKSDGSIGSENKAVGTDWFTEQYISYGGSSDLWSESWTAEDINNSNFGVAVNAISENAFNVLPKIDHIRITVDYTESASNPTVQGITNITGAQSITL